MIIIFTAKYRIYMWIYRVKQVNFHTFPTQIGHFTLQKQNEDIFIVFEKTKKTTQATMNLGLH